MALINNITSHNITDDTKRPVVIARTYVSFFEQIFNLLSAMTQSGTTAQRPTTFLWVGRNYFDTTLGYPIWLKSVGPTVWVNGSGSPV